MSTSTDIPHSARHPGKVGFLDRVRDRAPSWLQPKDWVALHERETLPPTQLPPRGLKRDRLAVQPAETYIPPHEVPLTRGSLARRAGIAVVWLLVVVVILRGVQGIVAGTPRPVIHVNPVVETAGSWPDQTTDAFAVRFATTYLTLRQGAKGARKQYVAISPFLTQALAQQLEPATGDQQIQPISTQADQHVVAANVAGATKVDASHALIKVGVTSMTSAGDSQYLVYTIPVYRSASGGLAVYALPAIVPGAPQVPSQTGAPNLEPISTPGVQTVVQRFLHAWLQSDATQMSYLATSGAKFYPMPTGLSLTTINQLQQVVAAGSNPSADPTSLTVDATITLLNTTTRTQLVADYYFRLVEQSDGNWYVQNVAAGT